jgi:hypothetical protein
MDPNTVYKWITEAWVRFDAAAGNATEQGNIAREIHDYWDALDQWIKDGGYLPQEWRR